jgi:glucokinase
MDAVHVGALDVGGTKLAAMVAGPDGPLARVTQFTIKSGTERALPEQALSLLDLACAEAGIAPESLTAVGVASTGPFVTIDGMAALATPNICGGRSGAVDLPNDWETIPLEAVLRERFNRVVIENDCVAAIAAERTFGAVKDEPDCVYVTWSTGVGFGLCVEGRILHGKHGNAGHAGHMLISETDDALCGCGNRGDLEALISGRNIANRLGTSSAELFRRARDGEPDARAVVEEAARRLGRALYNMTAILDTRTFVVGGSVWQNHGDWLAPIVQYEIDSRLPALTAGVKVLPAQLGSLVADVGAFSLVLPPEWVARWRDTEPWQVLTS